MSSVQVRRLLDDGTRVERAGDDLSCDLVCVSGGWNPTIHLQSQSRARPRYDPERGIFLPGEPIQAERSAGACNGAFALAACLAEGARAGVAAAEAAGFEAKLPDLPRLAEPDEAPPRLLWRVPSGRPLRKSKQFVDFQNDVTAADIDLALREGYRSIEHVKRYTTTGMGTDQGKTSNVNALGIVSGITGQPIAELGVTTFRPPYIAGALRSDRRAQLRRVVRAGAAHADAGLARGGGRRVRGRRPVAPTQVLPAFGRGHAGRGRARGRGRAHEHRQFSMPARSARSISRGVTPPCCSIASTPMPGASSPSAAAATV